MNTYWTVGKFLINALVFVGVIAGVYFMYRSYSAASMSGIVLLQNYSNTPAVICKSSSSGFDGSEVRTTYMSNGSIRADSTSISAGLKLHIHLIIDPEKRFYLWSDEDKGRASTFVFDKKKMSVENQDLSGITANFQVAAQGSCSPWWSPNATLLVPPDDVHFVDTSATS